MPILKLRKILMGYIMNEKEYLILAINPGSTSTKVGVYKNNVLILVKNIEHSVEELSKYERIVDQFEMRKDAILEYLKEKDIDVKGLSIIVARGGTLPPVDGGAIYVNNEMVNLLKSGTLPEHASNLAALIGKDMADSLRIPVIIYDGVSTNELTPIAKISGYKEIERASLSHALNSKAVSRKVAAEDNKTYDEVTYVVAHLGGGITLSIHHKGKMIDIISDDEGPFSPERAGKVPCLKLVETCYSGKYDYNTMRKSLRGKGGLTSYLGTNSAIEVEKRIKAGDEEAQLIYEAMAYQVAKGIGELSVVVKGKVDKIIITGGIAYSKMMTELIKDYVSFIAPVVIVPGENEIESLALGGLRVVRGEETAREFKI